MLIQSFAYIYPQRFGYIGFVPEANFDGKFYIAISQYWYRGLDQAFFPLYPVFIRFVNLLFETQPAVSGLIVSVSALFIGMFFFQKLVEIDYKKKITYWSLLFLLFFPTAFFLGAVYTESLFLSLVFISFYFIRKRQIILASIFALLATATRIVGIFLLPVFIYELYLQKKPEKANLKLKQYLPLLAIPAGLLSYMGYLWYRYSDPLLFIHIQPAFGAGRSGGEIVLLPQVLYRYLKILFSVSWDNLTFFVSALELFMLITLSVILFFAYKKGIRKSYILFSFIALYFPTLSGTLSSLPRYALVCFAVYIFLGGMKNTTLKFILLCFGAFLEAVLAILFLRGYFIS